jgi:hypothetical protein
MFEPGNGAGDTAVHRDDLRRIDAVLQSVAIAFARAAFVFQLQMRRPDSLALIFLAFRLRMDPRFLLRDFRSAH